METENSSGDFNRTKRTLSGSPEKKLVRVHESESDNSSGDFKRTKRTLSRSPEKKPVCIHESESESESESENSSGDFNRTKPTLSGSPKKNSEVNKHYKDIRDREVYDVSYRPVRYWIVNVDKERELLNELSGKCIVVYNKNNRQFPNYEFLDVVMASKQLVAGYNYYITFRARQIDLPDMVKTFRGNYYYCRFNRKAERVSRVWMMKV